MHLFLFFFRVAEAQADGVVEEAEVGEEVVEGTVEAVEGVETEVAVAAAVAETENVAEHPTRSEDT